MLKAMKSATWCIQMMISGKVACFPFKLFFDDLCVLDLGEVANAGCRSLFIFFCGDSFFFSWETVGAGEPVKTTVEVFLGPNLLMNEYMNSVSLKWYPITSEMFTFWKLAFSWQHFAIYEPVSGAFSSTEFNF